MARRLHLPAMHPTSPRGVSTPADASRRPMPRRRASPPHAPSPRAAAPCPITVRRHPQPPLTAGSDPTTIAMARRLHLPAMHPTSPRGVSTPADASRRPNPPLPRVSMGNIQPVPEPHPTGAAHCSRGASAPRRRWSMPRLPRLSVAPYTFSSHREVIPPLSSHGDYCRK
ncbi:hypothetical protein VPH35_037004 [Triticum aestivum]